MADKPTDVTQILADLCEAARRLYDIVSVTGYPRSTLEVYKRAITAAEVVLRKPS